MSGGALPQFTPLVSRWFAERFGDPTPIQRRAWPAVARGQDVLITAPTGSGKTLAAFLYCLDRLIRRAGSGALESRTEVLYVSPLKALSNDIHRNLEQPLAELGALAERLGLPRPDVRAAIRTGDTPAHERRAAVKKPPHVLVTTPESLYILLTSESGRRALADVRTVIVDEIHAIAADKRGAHLALSLERVDDLVARSGGARPQRIGLSATVQPMEVASRLLVGNARELPEIVDVGHQRELDLRIEVLKDELGAVSTTEQWGELYDRLAELASKERSTIVFVNTRRLVERLAHHLAERMGAEHVAAHHGSLSRARRFEAERRLKHGELKVVVATASLELGIDVGSVDLACLVGSPRSISVALQRVGRSGHALGATPKGRLFPLTRDQLVECAAIVRAARRGVLDRIAWREWPLDVLSQQIVAMCACEERGEDELFSVVTRAAPYAELPREKFDAVVTMLSEGIATRRGRTGALLHRDAVAGKLRGRRNARIVALTSGGAIPDNANYDVLVEPEGTKVGTVDEDFAVESMAGDVFLLGNTSWRIRRVGSGVVRVEDARGAAPSIPFWLGEAPARTSELSRELGELHDELDRRLSEELSSGKPGEAPASIAWLVEECGLDRAGAELVRAYLAAGRAALGAIASQNTVVVERFFDEAGGMQLVLHAPFGGKVNRAWGLALRKRFCRMFDFELQAAATDDGVLLSLGPQHSFPLESVLELLAPGHVGEILEQAALQAPMFGTRWRWNATRSLALVRHQGGKRVPPPILRMRSDDLLAAVFPAQQGCQDNHGVGAHIEPPDHPLVFETMRDCKTEVMDVDGLEHVLGRLARGEIRRVCVDSPEPSVFSHEILNANPYAFLDDAPLEERRARAVNVRRGLPAEIVERVGGLDPAAIAAVRDEARPVVRDLDELHDLLLDLGALPEAEASAAGWSAYFAALVVDRRAARLAFPGGAVWVAAERRSIGAAIFPHGAFEPELVAPAQSRGAHRVDRDDALVEVVRARLAISGPVRADELAAALGLESDEVDIALARVEGEGTAMRGRFDPALPDGAVQWCDRTLLARIHRRTVDRLRADIEPVSAADLIRFLCAWQHVRPASRQHGREGLSRVVGQLEGFELAAGAWEREVLPARVATYDPAWLDLLCLSGEVVWGKLAPRDAASAPTRAAPITLARRRDLPWLLAARDQSDVEGLGHASRDVLAYLARAGASFADEIAAGARRLPCEVEEALWELVAAGRVTGDGFGGLRALLTPASRRSAGPRGRPNRSRRGAASMVAAGRWALLAAPAPLVRDAADPALSEEARVEAFARLYVRRYGIVMRELLVREPHAPPWRELLRVYRTLEMRGEVRGGRMVAGFVGEQFAAPEAIDALRAIRREPPRGEIVRVSACDPLNLVGILTPGPRVPATLGAWVSYRDGVPIADDGRPRLVG